MVLLPLPPVHQVKGIAPPHLGTFTQFVYTVRLHYIHSRAPHPPNCSGSLPLSHRSPHHSSLCVYETAALGTVCEWNHTVLLGPTCHTEHGAFSLQPCCRYARIPFLNKQHRVLLCGVSCFSTCPQMGTWAWTSTKGPWHLGVNPGFLI